MLSDIPSQHSIFVCAYNMLIFDATTAVFTLLYSEVQKYVFF